MKVFTAPWCKQCEALKDTLAQAGVPFEVIDIDKHSQLGIDEHIKAVPTTILDDGRRLIGVFNPYEEVPSLCK